MEEQHKSKIVWVLFIIIVALVGLNIYQYYLANNLEVDTEVAVVETSATPASTVSATPTTTETIANNVFNLATAKVGDKVGTMTVTSIEPYFPAQSATATNDNCKITFSGEATISGEYSYINTALAGYMLTFGLDINQNPQLPVLTNDKNSNYKQINSIFFKNTDSNKAAFGINGNTDQTGSATIKIANFSINHAPSEVMNTADLVEVLSQ